ncbi:hypothetical protein [Parvicella tangerina]|uniref:Sulfotransferase n=1 Tax=Parvicella tangerina TaxID=2829795 RepID=A0A916NGG1_9FLAO|nr:hypothetical protein [Parvicella tangerina]CAG5079722.1 hypothetical protein CRYO30217_01034 [Parvicella tangerina]
MIRSVKNKVKEITRRKDLLKNGHFVFSVNTGRSGSDYLGSLLATSKEVLAYHEREPYMTGKYLRLVEKLEMDGSKKDRMIKVNSILRDLAISGKRVYAESNHMFAKTFYDVALESFDNVTVIHLERNIKDTAKSFLKLRYFTDENDVWSRWMIHPNAPMCFLKFPQLVNEYELIFGYLAEMRYRSQYIKENFNANHIEVKLEQLNDITFVSSLFKKIGLSMTDKTKNLVGKKLNDRQDRKNDFTFKFSQEKFDAAYQRINAIYQFEN